MVFKNFKRSCICVSAFLLSVSFPLGGLAEQGKSRSTEPVTASSIVRQPEGYSSDGQQVVIQPTDPVTVTSAIPETSRAMTDSINTTERNPTGVSSKSNILEKQASFNINDNVVMVSGRLSTGLLNGKARELVYNPSNGHKNSELDWNLDQVFMLGAGVSIKPLSWLRFNADIWFKVNEGNGSMDDFDWRASNFNDWTDWSHSDAPVTEGSMFDINTELTFLRFNKTSFFAIIGFKHDHWKWDAKGGSFVYSSIFLRDTVGNFPDDLTLGTYEQTFDVPYLGIGFHANLNPVTLSGRVIGSTLVSSKDEDHHLLSDLVVTSSLDSGRMLGLDFACTYNFTPHIATTAAFQYQKYEELKGSHTWNYFSEGVQFSYDGGLDNETTLVYLSLLFTL